VGRPSPSPLPWGRRWIANGQTYGCLPSCRASFLIDQYQIQTWRVAVYLGTHCSIGCMQYRRQRFPPAYSTGDTTVYLLTHKLFSSCIRRYLVSRAATEWCQRYLPCYLLSVSNSVCFSSMSEATQLQRRTWFTEYRTFDVAENVGSTFLVRGVRPGERLWIDSNGKNGNTHYVDGYFCSEFRAICNHCGVIWRPEVVRPGNFATNFNVFSKTTRQNFQNSVQKVFTTSLIDVVLFKFCEMLPTGNRLNRALFTGPNKFRLPLNLSLLPGSRLKSAKASHQQCIHSAQDFIQISSLSAEL